MSKPTLYLIDGNSYIYRAYHAVRSLATSKGLPTNAIYGFTNMLLKIVKEKKPDYLAIAFDTKGPTKRHIEYEQYKAHRPEMPKDLIPQIPYIHKLVEAFNIPAILMEGYEADDIIGTISKKMEKDFDVVIVTGDKDMLQLISQNIKIYDTLKEKVYEEKDVVERFGVAPDKVVEVMGLMGDASDNIPGVHGIGEKTATALIAEFGSIENLLSNIDKIKKPKLAEALKGSADIARLSRELATIILDCPIEINLNKYKKKEPDNAILLSLLKELEFTSLLKQISVEASSLEEKKYSTVLKEDALLQLIKKIREKGELSIDTETTSEDPMLAEIVGISISIEKDEGFYIPVSHRYLGAPEQLKIEWVLNQLKPLLEDDKIKKIGQNIKYEIIVFKNHGIGLSGISFDTMVASYLLNPNKYSHGLDNIALEYLNHIMTTFKDVTGSGKGQKNFSEVDIETATNYSCEDADITYQLTKLLNPMLKEQGLDKLFYDVELPLIPVLARIEMNGVKVDTDFLNSLSKEVDALLNDLVKRIYSLAGGEFNINSPKQLSEVLFTRLGLKPVKKTKTGHSTDEEVLTTLASQHELPKELLNYRQLTKLKSTYIDALPRMVHPKTKRIHTSLNQTVTSTGRLSSSEPNLQNIPIRTELGKRIREAFVAEEGKILISADYSQIELRILAHLSNDEVLTDAFKKDEDVHTRTAAELFNVEPDKVDSNMRRFAKTVNFGIVYGMSPYGLSSDLGIPVDEAKAYIDNYFVHYKGVKEFIDKTIAEAKEKGYVTTILNRKRSIPELISANGATRNFGERMAVNTPIQGSAADLIKMAMINIDNRLDKERLKSMMILQVHDELVFEVIEDELEIIKELVKKEMENVMPMSVPIKVDIGTGKNWREAG
ncbi:MAG: DNA polymerase I [Nitrospirae bacterium RBG_19FT_COMBO_42_15]|nr:MAG: DNA polymerase I [Nitrospirae bacterium RBG_19FT_COMBO_42_15]